MTDELIIGIPSGSIRNGVSAVLVNFTRNSVDLLHAQCTPYPAAIRQTLSQLLESPQSPTSSMASLLDETLGHFFARIAQDLVREAGMEMRDILAIGSHGQNVRQTPLHHGPVTMPLGNTPLLARNTGVTVVSGFRDADVAAGGQGAPLEPLLHKQLFANKDEDRAVLDIGEAACVTLLPASGIISGFDCGPGTCLMDAWTRRHLQKPRDHVGNWAAKGKINEPLLKRLLQNPHFDTPAPGSTGLACFDLAWLDDQLADSGLTENGLDLADVQATITELTALAIGRRLQGVGVPKRLLVCGIGAHNRYLLGRIAAALPDVVVDTTARYGADPNWMEGLLFAWLARERLAGRMQDTPPVTGARHAVLLGDIFEP